MTKNKKSFYILILLILIMTLSIFGVFVLPKIITYPGYVSCSGKYLQAKNNTHILVGQRGYRIMIPQNESLFEDISDGDSIWIKTKGSFLDSKNGENIATYSCTKIFDGNYDDISELVIEELIELNYLDSIDYGYK